MKEAISATKPADVAVKAAAGQGTTTQLVVGRDICRVYQTRQGDIVALESVDFTVGPGEIVALLGPSGCGKSTLLKLVGGLYAPTSGTLHLGGRPIEGPSTDVGFMFQTPVLFPWRTAVDNVLVPPTIKGRVSQSDRRRARELLELVGLNGFAEAMPSELSGGMQQRVAICRMLMGDPALLLMDEPFGALDELTRERMDIEIRRLARTEGKTALFVTHSLQEAVYVADRILVMSGRPGRIVGEIKVDLPAERGDETLDSPEVLAHVRAARSMLEAADRAGADHWAEA